LSRRFGVYETIAIDLWGMIVWQKTLISLLRRMLDEPSTFSPAGADFRTFTGQHAGVRKSQGLINGQWPLSFRSRWIYAHRMSLACWHAVDEVYLLAQVYC
jgi:hypothetical protein